MSYTAFSVGRDTQLVVMTPSGRIDLAYVTSFESRQLTHPVRVNRMDGTQLGTELPRGWEGFFELDRGSSAVDDFIARTEQQFFNGGGTVSGTMYQYITEPDGSTSTFQYDGVSFRLSNSGTWRGDASVKQKLEFFATTRRRI